MSTVDIEVAGQILDDTVAELTKRHKAEMAAFARTIVKFRDGLIEGVERGARAAVGVSA